MDCGTPAWFKRGFATLKDTRRVERAIEAEVMPAPAEASTPLTVISADH